jgi:anti-sigma factor RsiW
MIDTPRQEPDASLRVNAAIDEELDAANALQFERDLANDPALQALHTQIGAASQAVRRAAARERAPAELRARLLRMAEVREARPSRSIRFANVPRALAAAIAAIAAIAALAWALRVAGPVEDPELQALVSGYMRGQVSGQPFDVASSDRHTVKPWLASRVTLGAAVVDLAESGYPLAGGRIDIVDRTPVPTLVYRRREHFIAVSELPVGRGMQPWRGSVDGFHFERWADTERAYVAVSDIDAPDLSAFVEAFRAAQRAGAQGDAAPAKP